MSVLLKIMTVVDYESIDLNKLGIDEKSYLYNVIMSKLVGNVILADINPLICVYRNEVLDSMIDDRMDTYFEDDLVVNSTTEVLNNIAIEINNVNYKYGKLENYNIVGTDNLCIISTLILGENQ